MALNQEDIDVGAAPNDGQGDPIRTAFVKCNDNFTQLYSLPNPTPPTTLIGAPGDMPGMYAYDDTYFYYCYDNYNGVSTIWGQLIQSDEAASSIGNGLSNVVIAFANANITVGVAGTSNVAVFGPTALTVRGAVNSNTMATGSLVAGNFIVAGDTISSLGEIITISPAGNVVFGDVVINSSFSILGPTTTTESQSIVIANTAANITAANGAGIQIGQADYAHFTFDATANRWSAYPRLETPNLFIDATTPGTGNIFGAFNISASNTTYSGGFVGNTANIGSVSANSIFAVDVFAANLHGEGSRISNITGANVVGAVALANLATFALNTTGSAESANYANFAGSVINTFQPNITSVGTLNTLTVSGLSSLANVNTGAFVIGSGVITAPFVGTHGNTTLRGTIGANSNSQPNITSVGTLANLFVSGESNFGNNVTVFGNLFAGNIFGNITANTKFAEFVTSNSQPNITGVGNMTGLEVNNITFYTDIVGNSSPAANTSVYARNIIANNIGFISNIGVTSLRGTLSIGSNAQPNITTLGTLVSLSVNGAISTNTLSTTGNATIGGNLTVAGNITFTGNIQEITGNSGQFFGNNATGFGALYAGVTTGYANVPNSPFEVATNFDGYSQISNQNINPGAKASGDFVITADNGNDTSNYINLGITSSTWDGSEPNSLGNAVGRTDGYLGMQGGIGTGGNLIIGTTTTGKAVRFVVGGPGNANVAVAMNGAEAISTTTTSGALVVFGGCGITGNLNANLINSIGNISAPSFNWANGSPLISPSGNLNAAFINVSGDITAAGNVTAAFFNGTATSAQYADLAENYLADVPYQPGTVVSFGGVKEVTVSTEDLDVLVAGVVSTKPAYTMNSGLVGDYTTPVALMGRVPCRVTGSVTRGAMMVSNGDGTARAEKNPVMGSVIGKALESFDGDVGVIEIVVGKL
jgi:hypothetical protein